MFSSTIVAGVAFLLTRHILSWSEADLVEQGLVSVAEGGRTWVSEGGLLRSLNEAGVLVWSRTAPKLVFARWVTIGLPLVTGVISGVIGSLVTKPPRREAIERFFTKIYVPIGQDEKLALPLDKAVPASRRLVTVGGLFVVRPSRQSWVGFVVALGLCLVCVLVMLAILR